MRNGAFYHSPSAAARLLGEIRRCGGEAASRCEAARAVRSAPDRFCSCPWCFFVYWSNGYRLWTVISILRASFLRSMQTIKIKDLRWHWPAKQPDCRTRRQLAFGNPYTTTRSPNHAIKINCKFMHKSKLQVLTNKYDWRTKNSRHSMPVATAWSNSCLVIVKRSTHLKPA